MAKKNKSKNVYRDIWDDEDDFAYSDVNHTVTDQSDKTNRHNYKKTRLKKSAERSNESHCGKVIAGVGARWLVAVDHKPEDEIPDHIECSAAGIIVSEHDDASLIAVGDDVGIEVRHNGDNLDASIVRVGQRHTRLSRTIPAKHKTEQVVVSNIDQLVIVMAAAEPFFNTRLIDRYLIAADKGDLIPIICINKVDLMPMDYLEEQLQVYKDLKYEVVFTSVKRNIGVDNLRALMIGKSSVLSGPSGVGKSSLTNALLGYDKQHIGEVSGYSFKGIHTTSFVRMFPLPEGGYLVDTPGLREFAIWDLDKDELPYYFHEFDEFRYQCRFTPCSHIHEPDCAIIKAVEKGLIHPERYQSYLNIAASLDEEQ